MEINTLLKAADFAADKHKMQRRKGYLRIPYINHPLKVALILTDAGESSIDLIISALLHDVLEDTPTTKNEIENIFGLNVLSIIIEVTDNMSLSEKERKAEQIIKAPGLSDSAKKIKIADKICNIRDILNYPIHWSRKRKLRYVEWSKQVVDCCCGVNQVLDEWFEEVYKKGTNAFK